MAVGTLLKKQPLEVKLTEPAARWSCTQGRARPEARTDRRSQVPGAEGKASRGRQHEMNPKDPQEIDSQRRAKREDLQVPESPVPSGGQEQEPSEENRESAAGGGRGPCL